jgi:hypothetical protein
MAETNDVPRSPAGTGESYVPDEVILYGVSLEKGRISLGKTREGVELNLSIALEKSTETKLHVVIAVVYGYAYEGHCYRMDRPKILALGAPSVVKREPAIGCGFAAEDGYFMWRLRANQELLELDTSVGTLQTVVLDANLPGRRSPSTYAAHMQLAHRGGRLT